MNANLKQLTLRLQIFTSFLALRQSEGMNFPQNRIFRNLKKLHLVTSHLDLEPILQEQILSEVQFSLIICEIWTLQKYNKFAYKKTMGYCKLEDRF